MCADAAVGRNVEGKESKYNPELIISGRKVVAQSTMEGVQCGPQVTAYLAGLPRKPYHTEGPALLLPSKVASPSAHQ